MNRNQLKYFVAAAESRSFTKAAEQFYISQTAITQQIRLLEEALGNVELLGGLREAAALRGDHLPPGGQGDLRADEPGAGAGP